MTKNALNRRSSGLPMSQPQADRQVEEDAFLRSGLDVPLDHELRQMSFVELAALLSSCESGPAFPISSIHCLRHFHRFRKVGIWEVMSPAFEVKRTVLYDANNTHSTAAV